MSFKDAALNFLTMGSHDQLEAIRRTYREAYEEYRPVRAAYDASHSAYLTSLSKLGEATSEAMLALTQSYKIILFPERRSVRKLSGVPLSASEAQAHPKLEQLTELIGAYTAINSTAGGVGAGSAVAIGSWSLVTMIGTASTGTAISTLSGVAATNATLAWFGGGALAAGGAGMAGGAVMLGGLALVPLVAFASWHARTKIKEVAAATEKLKAETVRTSEAETALREQMRVVEARIICVRGPTMELMKRHSATHKMLFPRKALSVILKSCKRLFGIRVFNDAETDAIKELEAGASRLITLFHA